MHLYKIKKLKQSEMGEKYFFHFSNLKNFVFLYFLIFDLPFFIFLAFKLRKIHLHIYDVKKFNNLQKSYVKSGCSDDLD